MSLGSFRVVGFVGVRNRGRWVHSGSLGLFMCALGFVWVAVWLVQVHPGDSWVHTVSLGSLWYNLADLWFSRGCSIDFGARWGSLCSLGDDGFIRVRPVCRWVHLESLDTFGCALGVVGFIRGSWVRSGALSGSSG